MKQNKTHRTNLGAGAAGLLSVFILCCLSASSVHAVDWFGGAGNWTDDSWSGYSGDYPGRAIAGVDVGISNARDVVTINTVLPHQLGALRIEHGGTLNLVVGGSAETGPSFTTQWDRATVNFTGGNFTVAHSLSLGRTSGASGTTQINISSGTLNYSGGIGGGRTFTLRNDARGGGVNIDISGTGTLQVLNGGKFDHMSVKTVNLNLSDSATFDLVGATASSVWDMAGDTGVTGLTHTVSIVGSSVTAEVGGVNAFATDADHRATFKFIADDSGFSTYNVAGVLILNGGDHAADLIVDLNGLTSGTYDLFRYTALAGTFNSVTYLNGTGTLDYGTGSSRAIKVKVIPEPCSYALALGIFGLGLVLRRRHLQA